MSKTVITQKISAYSIVKQEVDKAVEASSAQTEADKNLKEPEHELQLMHENLNRPESLHGSTYKIKTPLSEHALYITINDISLNPGTAHERLQPFEIFINSKNLEHFQWVVALTRVISAVFRKGGDITFLVEELKAVFDPTGGYFKSGGLFMPSLVAEIGEVIETHLKKIGLLETEGLSEHQQKILQEKQEEYLQRQKKEASKEADTSPGFPSDASMCFKCQYKSVIIMDGCKTCLNCGDSKCG